MGDGSSPLPSRFLQLVVTSKMRMQGWMWWQAYIVHDLGGRVVVVTVQWDSRSKMYPQDLDKLDQLQMKLRSFFLEQENESASSIKRKSTVPERSGFGESSRNNRLKLWRDALSESRNIALRIKGTRGSGSKSTTSKSAEIGIFTTIRTERLLANTDAFALRFLHSYRWNWNDALGIGNNKQEQHWAQDLDYESEFEQQEHSDEDDWVEDCTHFSATALFLDESLDLLSMDFKHSRGFLSKKIT
ncbi:hypothetical protein Tco_1539853 [Tanacetum coccineum]|uniref:Uncharacterized protein n=1 Tax=Tanacetum coccineum TaxID=301880 RepID=A0ABQ5GQM0_9ASTR